MSKQKKQEALLQYSKETHSQFGVEFLEGLVGKTLKLQLGDPLFEKFVKGMLDHVIAKGNNEGASGRAGKVFLLF